MMKSLEKRLQKIESSLFPTFPKHGSACSMVRKHYDSDFNGDAKEALKIIDAEIRKEAEQYRTK